eukprot:CAMPEP_0114114806 /NCGR_PEP_ID=MMETSP0043_2-20121206/3628_1 /TAXON_ID=464988 /ORGANISM="Hemiselmis andersenii, Strain CCMP644" /LENGTH=129 /DNA_ID=CAMNT_0001207019 /DNA_START=129 /DNA_END=514 /DNA_ORIENTATION=-
MGDHDKAVANLIERLKSPHPAVQQDAINRLSTGAASEHAPGASGTHKPHYLALLKCLSMGSVVAEMAGEALVERRGILPGVLGPAAVIDEACVCLCALLVQTVDEAGLKRAPFKSPYALGGRTHPLIMV